MDQNTLALQLIPLVLSIGAVIFSGGQFFAKAKQNETDLRNLNAKVDQLTRQFHEFLVEFAEFRGASKNGSRQSTTRGQGKIESS